MSRLHSLCIGLTLLATTSGAFAHAHLKSSVPIKNASVTPATTAVTLSFTEAVHTKMSQFKVYPVKDMAAAEAAFKTAFNDPHDTAARADLGLAPVGDSSESVTVRLKQPLKPGTYLVAWKVMAADDGHITNGHYVFTVKAK